MHLVHIDGGVIGWANVRTEGWVVLGLDIGLVVFEFSHAVYFKHLL